MCIEFILKQATLRHHGIRIVPPSRWMADGIFDKRKDIGFKGFAQLGPRAESDSPRRSESLPIPGGGKVQQSGDAPGLLEDHALETTSIPGGRCQIV